jgi:hypothetical protein
LVSWPAGCATPISRSAFRRSPWTSDIHPATTTGSAPASSVWRYLARRRSQSSILRVAASIRAPSASVAPPHHPNHAGRRRRSAQPQSRSPNV